MILMVGLLMVSTALAVSQRSTGVQTYAASSDGQLDMTVAQGDIYIEVWNSSEVSVEGIGMDSSELLVSPSGGNVVVEYDGEKGDVEFRVKVPANFNVSLTTGAGDIQIQGDLGGDLVVKTSGGDIEFESVVGKVEVTTSGGDIEGADVGKDTVIKTSGGDIEIGTVGGMLTVMTNGGDIEVNNVEGNLEALTMGGDVEFGDVTGTATVKSSGGDITLGHVTESVTVTTAGGDLKVLSASGKVSATTAGGDIVLDDVEGSISATTAGGDIAVQLSPAAEDSELTTAAGDIVLSIPGGVGATVAARIDLGDAWDERGKYKIASDFPAASYEEDSSEQAILATYEINGGGPLVTIKTAVGNITIKGVDLR
jgi:hypothetical protein